MKKRIFILIICLLLTTGCTCEYNLKIEGDTYKEEIILLAENENEKSQFNSEWKIPTNKEDYENLIGLDGVGTAEGEIYKYSLLNNKLTFNYVFSQSNYNNSPAVSKCYNKLTVTKHEDEIIISTSNKNNCFDEYPDLKTIKVNIQVDKKVISNNADSVRNNIYTWNLSKDKSINLILEDDGSTNNDKVNISDENEQNKRTGKYDLYIFLLILLVVAFIGYKFIMKFKDRNNSID